MVCGIDADVRDVAAAMGRGRRSGVGTAAFQAGGFVIDAGHKKGQTGRDATPTVVWRRDFPADWRFIVAVPDADKGLSGRSEEGVFGALAPSVRISEEVCRITQLRLMPALVEHDIEEFGRALTAVDRMTGAYFSDVQGGVYSGGETNAAIDALLRAGAHGAGQTSWGPAVYGLVHERDVGKVEMAVRESLIENGGGAQVFVSHGRNTEARVEVPRAAL
jgi:beta-ribofuranosylaminobenzene 5'-phosphate synthase